MPDSGQTAGTANLVATERNWLVIEGTIDRTR